MGKHIGALSRQKTAVSRGMLAGNRNLAVTDPAGRGLECATYFNATVSSHSFCKDYVNPPKLS